MDVLCEEVWRPRWWYYHFRVKELNGGPAECSRLYWKGYSLTYHNGANFSIYHQDNGVYNVPQGLTERGGIQFLSYSNLNGINTFRYLYTSNDSCNDLCTLV